MTRQSAEDLEIAARRTPMDVPSGLPGLGLVTAVVLALLALALLAMCSAPD